MTTIVPWFRKELARHNDYYERTIIGRSDLIMSHIDPESYTSKPKLLVCSV